MIATMTTAILPTMSVSQSVAFFLRIGLYISAVKELDATSSWESAVETDAAIIAASRKPAMAGGKNLLAMAMNTVFCAPTVSSSSAMTILAR